MTATVRLLGEAQVYDGRQWHHPALDKRLALLAYLACQQGWVEREKLAFLFWPDVGHEQARTNLRGLLARSKALPFSDALEADSNRMRWRGECDVRRFRAAIAEQAWHEATTLYRGQLLGGSELDDCGEISLWLQMEREGLREEYRSAVFQRSEELRAGGLAREATKLLGRLLEVDPLDEEALQRLMRHLAASGGSARALHLYRRFSDLLSDELGLKPTSVTEALAREIADQEPDSLELRPHQPQPSAGSASGAGLDPVASTPRTLSPTVPVGGFIGREREMADLARMLERPGCRLVTITGTGGVGKSRLAMQAAHELGRAYVDGAVFVPLDSVSSSSSISGSIAAALDLEPRAGEDPAAEVMRELNGREMLLILDNFEQLVDAAPVVLDLLRASAGLKLLVTSRERLCLAEEWVLPLSGLPFPSEGVSAVEARGYDAVRFFCERVEQVHPRFVLTPETLPPVLAICRLVEGLPLALELAAVWVRVLPVSEVAREIERNLGFLSSTTRNLPVRHRSIRAAFEHSWGLLTPTEQTVLRRLSAFRGGFRREAAAWVAGASIALLAALVDKSLLRVSAGGRYDRHPLLYGFLCAKLAEDPAEEAAARDRHAAYFVSLVEEVELHRGTEREREWWAPIRAESENFFSALEWAEKSGQADLAMRLAVAMRWWFLPRGHAGAVRDQLRRILAMPSKGRPRDRAQVLQAAAIQAHIHGDFSEAQELYEEALEIASEAGPREVVLRVLNNLGHIARLRGEYGRARRLLERSLELHEGERGRFEAANALNNLATLARLEGDLSTSRSLHEEALAIGREIGHKQTLSQSLSGLAYLARDEGNTAMARRLLEESLGLCRETSNYAGEGAALEALGLLAQERGDLEEARLLHAESLRVKRESGLRTHFDASLRAVAGLLSAAGEVEGAAYLWGAADAFRERRSMVLAPREGDDHRRRTAAARTALGEHRFEAAWAAGRAAEIEEAISIAARALCQPVGEAR